MKTRIHLVAGARPNFMKIGPVFHALSRRAWADPVIVNTGQHFSPEMSDVFYRDLAMPAPHVNLAATGESQARQTAAVMTAYETLCLTDRPRWTIVVGDVNSTLAACLAAKKLDIPVAHLEAGLRSGDRRMPEEINRVVVDAIADLFWTPSEDADANLLREGAAPDRIVRVGNVMIDAYCLLEGAIASAQMAMRLGLDGKPYVVTTLHRPVNVDQRATLEAIVGQLVELQSEAQVVFPVHPRTRARLQEYSLWEVLTRAKVRLLEPAGYIEFMSLVKTSAVVVTDSGGVQEETTYLGIPCLTVRDSTERPVTVTRGTNRLIGVADIAAHTRQALEQRPERPSIELWDGRAAERVADSLERACR